MTIDLSAAEAAVHRLAERLNLAPVQVAWGIHDIVDESMASAARVHLAERGRDPRNYVLLCTGGCGPVHGYYVARKLGIKNLICPPSAGVASALGLLVAPARVDRVATVGIRLDEGQWSALESAFSHLEQEARAVLEDTGSHAGTVSVKRFADARCVGQGFDLVVPLPPGPYSTGDPAAIGNALHSAFADAYREKFARPPPAVPVEFIHARVSVSVAMTGSGIALRRRRLKGDALKGRRQVYFPEAHGFVETPVYDQSRLYPGELIAGPAVVEENASTLIVGPGGTLRVLPTYNIVVTLP